MNRINSGVSGLGSSSMGSHGSNSLGSSGRGENLARVLARAGTNMTLACPGLTPTSYVYLVEWKCIGCKCTGQRIITCILSYFSPKYFHFKKCFLSVFQYVNFESEKKSFSIMFRFCEKATQIWSYLPLRLYVLTKQCQNIF